MLLLLLLASGCELWSMGQCMRPGDVGTASCLPARWLPHGTMCWRVLGRGIKDDIKIRKKKKKKEKSHLTERY